MLHYTVVRMRDLRPALLCLSLLVPAPALAATAIGIENQYADVIRQVGAPYVTVRAIESDPNTDPHSFEASPSVAAALAGASLVVENGLGYDSWADRILAATRAPARQVPARPVPTRPVPMREVPARQVINVQHLLGLPDSTRNPHLWYDPGTMPRVADAVAAALAAADPAHAAAFHANAARFAASLAPWRDALAAFRTAHPGTAVASTEPVADDMLEAAGCVLATPEALRLAIMNGTDPSPQDVSRQNALLTGRHVRALVYNQQVTDGLTQSFLARARAAGIPVVGVYETMPAGDTYQSWMLAEVASLARAVESPGH